ncbi:hypothetical protein L208DRAFT_1408584 [Tricholoma matsutake]|nr:hypothetical protein L208DRAFT_1408584 [Tricholoma matsutake 945]
MPENMTSPTCGELEPLQIPCLQPPPTISPNQAPTMVYNDPSRWESNCPTPCKSCT